MSNVQVPHYQAEEDMVLVSGTNFVRMSNIGGGSFLLNFLQVVQMHKLLKIFPEK